MHIAARRWLAITAVSVIIATILIVTLPVPGSGVLRVVKFDVGQGDCLLIEAPTGEAVMVDTGPPLRSGGAALDGAVLPYLDQRGIKFLDYLVLTHGHLDHTAGTVTLLENVEVGELWLGPMCGYGARLECEPEIRSIVRSQGVTVRKALRGEKLSMGEVNLEVLWPDNDRSAIFDLNENSVVARLTYRDWSMLLTGDLEGTGEWAVLGLHGEALESTALKVGHHGGAAATGEAFLSQVNPELAVICVGANPYGHPAPETLDRLSSSGVTVLRSDHHGAVIIETNGHQYRVMTMIRPESTMQAGG